VYLSHKYKFLFLRTPKTASSSICDFLIQNIDDPDAIYTAVEDSEIEGTLDNNLVEKYNDGYRYCHFRLQDLIDEKVIDRDQALNYKKIAVLREPIDRQMSFYYFFKQWTANFKRPGTLEEYKMMAPNGYFPVYYNSAIEQSSMLSLDGSIIGIYWLYEDLEKELYKFMNELGIEIKYPLPKHKSEARRDRPKNEFYFDEESLDKIKIYFKWDFELYERIKRERNETI
jgi:hypothetical protein